MADLSCFPPLPDDLDELFSEELLRLLASADACGPIAEAPCPSHGPLQGFPSLGMTHSCDFLNLFQFAHQGPESDPSSSHSDTAASPNHDCAASLRIVTTSNPKDQAKNPPRCNSKSNGGSGSPGSSSMESEAFDKVMSSDFENDSDMDIENTEPQTKVNKRKAPEVDWRSITDPAERRRQRRLAKNRVTAARSRERKKVQWADMENKLHALEQENAQLRAMLERMTRENGSLKSQLVNLASKPRWGGSSVEPAVLIFIATLLLLCCFLPTEKALLLGSCAPLVAMAHALAKQVTSSPCHDPKASLDIGKLQGHLVSDKFLSFLLNLKFLLWKSPHTLRSSIHQMLFQRRYLPSHIVTSFQAAVSSMKAEPSSVLTAARGVVCS